MNTQQENYLWDPTSDADAEIAILERILEPHSARALKLASHDLAFESFAPLSQRRWRAWQLAVLALAATFAGVALLHFHRLSWTENSPWPMTVSRGDVRTSTQLQVGDSITTTKGETATLSVARIGAIEIAADSSVALIQTSNRKHRLDLKYGRLHARIWAPPGYFGVANREALALDLGCEFDIEADVSGSGTLAVSSGWVIYNHRGTEVLVPEDHTIVFNDERVGTPIRNGADETFRELITSFDLLLISGSTDSPQIQKRAAQIALAADDADQITLLSLVTRHRELTRSALNDRLRQILGDPGEVDPINEWWSRLPKQPKRWWLNWRDGL